MLLLLLPSFNSYMVRFKVGLIRLENLYLLSFNSYMVRFKDIPLLCRFGSCLVSIPIWFDLKVVQSEAGCPSSGFNSYMVRFKDYLLAFVSD